MNKNRVFFRVDGNTHIGLGHVVRCIALAQMLMDKFEIIFFSSDIPEALKDEILSLNFLFFKISTESEFFEALTGKEIVVLDNYFFDTDYQKRVKEKGTKLVCIDDLIDKEFYADLIVNVTPNIKESDYSAQAYTTYAIGLKYALLRPAFVSRSGHRKTVGREDKLLLCLGGSDSNNVTLRVLKEIEGNFKGTMNIVIGSSYPHLDELQRYVHRRALTSKIEIHHNVGPDSFVMLMQSCGIAICSPSTVSIEYLSVTKGILYLYLTAGNQNNWFNYAICNKLAFKYSSEDSLRQSVHPNYALQDVLFDGKQPDRLLNLFLKYGN